MSRALVCQEIHEYNMLRRIGRSGETVAVHPVQIKIYDLLK